MKKKQFLPLWYHRIAPPKSYRSIFKWGAPDEFKHPNSGLYSLLKEKLGMTDEDFRTMKNAGEENVLLSIPVKLPPKILDSLRNIVGIENVRTDDYSRLKYAYGKTMLDLLRLRLKIAENVPDAVVCPRSKEDVIEIVGFCNKNKIPVTVFGGGSSVTRGVECLKGGISLDLGAHLNRILKLNTTNQTVTVEPGIKGPQLEKQLNMAPEIFGTMHRYSCGHFPQSFEHSTIGGWVATRGAGQNSTYYGKIENLVVSLECVTPSGILITGEFPAEAMGPDIDQIIIGSEGTYGIITGVTLKIFRFLPQNTKRFGLLFKTWKDGIEATREVMQSAFGFPSVFRLSDPEETEIAFRIYGMNFPVAETFLKLKGFHMGKMSMLIGSADGDADFAELVAAKVIKIAKNYGAISLTGIPARLWEKSRFKDPYMRDDLQDFGIITDTLECSACWDKIQIVWEKVKEFCSQREATVCMAHMSHFYPQGANLYFTFVARMETIDEYLQLQSGILNRILESGASLSHHHGIGKMIAPWFKKAVPEENLSLLRAIKKHLDPNNIMNPGGTLALDLMDDIENKKKLT